MPMSTVELGGFL